MGVITCTAPMNPTGDVTYTHKKFKRATSEAYDSPEQQKLQQQQQQPLLQKQTQPHPRDPGKHEKTEVSEAGARPAAVTVGGGQPPVNGHISSPLVHQEGCNAGGHSCDADEVKKNNGNGGGKYKCEYCGMGCAKPSVLGKHIRTHTNERPYRCDQCQTAFKTKSNYLKHTKSRAHANRCDGVVQDSGDGLVESGDCLENEAGDNVRCPSLERAGSPQYQPADLSVARSSLRDLQHSVPVASALTKTQQEDHSKEKGKSLYKPKFRAQYALHEESVPKVNTLPLVRHQPTPPLEPSQPECNAVNPVTYQSHAASNSNSPSRHAASPANFAKQCLPPLDVRVASASKKDDLVLAGQRGSVVTPGPGQSANSIWKGMKSPSPELLGQHITKLIVENQAIVETHNPLWAKRYRRQSSLGSSSSESDGSGSGKSRRGSLVDASSKSSKLAAVAPPASYGSLQAHPRERSLSLTGEALMMEPQSSYSPSLPPNPPHLALAQPPNTLMSASKPSISSLGLTTSYSQSDPTFATSQMGMHELDLVDGSRKRSISITEGPGVVRDPNKMRLHPKNPEGSVIKNLLLTARAGISSTIDHNLEKFEQGRIQSQNTVLVCSWCRARFPNPESLEYHLRHCPAYRQGGSGSERGTPDSIKSGEGGRWPGEQDVALDLQKKERHLDRYERECSSSRGSSVSLGEAGQRRPSDEDVKYRVEFYGGESSMDGASPPTKKRKLSEADVAAHDKNMFLSPIFSPKSQVGGKNESTLKMMEKPSSRHFFGGEVQICDGKNLKTMRIDPGQQPSPSLDICIPPQQLGGSITRTEVSVPTSVVVTIAKSGLNSGGTMVQVESQMSTSSTKTAPTLVNSLLPQEKQKPENSVHIPPKAKTAAPPTNIYPGNPSQFPFPNVFHQYAPLLPLPNLTIPGIPTPDLRDLSYPMNPPNMASQPFIHGQTPHPHKQNSHHSPAAPSRVSPLTLSQAQAGGTVLSHVTGVPGIRGSPLNTNISAISTAVLREKDKEHPKATSKLPSSYPALIPIGNEKVPYVPGIPGPYSQAGSVVHPSNSIQKSPLPVFVPPVPAPAISPVTSKGSQSSESMTPQGVISEGKDKMLAIPRPREILKEHQRNLVKEMGPHSPHKDSLKFPPKMASYVSPKESQIQGERPKQPLPQIKVPEIKPVNPEIRIHPAISSPPHEDKKDLEKGHISAEAQNSENSGKTTSSHLKDFLPPRKRPNTLALKPQPFTPKNLSLIGTTLVSPDTPRPKKNCVQMLLNGSAYTYLNHKVSTKTYFCCIYRQQPMYVPQSTDPKLSMYSNWQIRKPAEDNPFELTPYQSLGLYESRKYNESQKYNQHNATYTIAKEKELNLVQTHSSYWTFKEEKEKNKEKEKEESKMKSDEKDAKSGNSETEVSEQNAAETSGVAIKREPDDLGSSSINFKNDEGDGSGEGFAKRIKIFEGGFKSTEDYTYVRGRGRGRYVCEACGIRCKKPSMLKKHIRTHTDLRPYSCGHCSFSFKTKGNLTKHLRSKAHYKRCVEMGVFPVPTVVDESHINEEALAMQGKMEQDRADDEDDDEDDEDDDDDDDGDDEDDDIAMDEDQFEDAEEFKDIKATNADKDQDGRPVMENKDVRDIIVPTPQVSRAGVLVMMPSVSSTLGSSNAAYSTPDNKGSKTSGGVDSSRDSPMDLSVKKMPTPISSPALDKGSLGKKPSVPMRPNFLPLMSKSAVAELRSPVGNLGSPGTPSTPIREHPSEILSPVTESSTLLKSIYNTTHRISNVSSGEPHNIVPDPTKENGCSSSMLQAYLKERAVRDTAFKRQQYKSSSSDTSPDSPRAGAVQSSSDSGKQSTESEKLPRKIEKDLGEAAKIHPDNDKKEPNEDNASQGSSSEQTRSSTPSSVSTSSVVTSSQAVSSRMPTPPANLTVMYSGGADTKTAFLVPSGVVPSSLNRLGNDDGKCKCSVCHKEFNKQSQLSIHMNIHYMERPYRCSSCGVSFRTNGHLQKHRRSLSHFNKVNMNLTFGTPSTDNPRPFKCHDCKIAFRIHGHLAKHLRSKMHIMKLECLGKLPFGTYAEIERSGANLNEIDTTDCDNSLESLQAMASRLYEKDPSKLAALQNHQQERLHHRVRTVSNSSTNSDDYPLQDEQDDPLTGCGNDDDTEGDEDEELPLPHEAGRINISGTVLGPPSSESHSLQPNALQTIEVGSGATAGLVACYLCHEKFLDLEHLSGHLYNVHKQQLTQPTNQPFSCGLCEAKFSSHSQLMIHSQHHCSSAGIVGLKSS